MAAADQKDNPVVDDDDDPIPTPSFKISYFPFAGIAFSLRLTAFIGGISYSDEFVSSAEHKADKDAGGLRWNGLPELTIYDATSKKLVVIGQSNSCLRYIGTAAGLYSSVNPLISALIDEILDSVEDTRNLLTGSMKTKNQRTALIAADGILTYWLTKFELRFSENIARGYNNGYIVGDNMTIADIKLFELFHSLYLIFASYSDIPKDLISKSYPNIQKHYELMNQNDKIIEFLQRFSLRNSEYKMDPTDDDIKLQTYKGKFVPGSFN